MRTAVLVLVLATFFLVGFRRSSRRLRQDDSPRRLQQASRRIFFISLPVIGVLAVVQAVTGQWNPWFFVCWAVLLISMGYGAFRAQTPKEVLRNYVQDSRHCGQCGYDLTGNVSGVCPECGWAIPPQLPVVERPRWACWWAGWQIGHLDNWRRSLASMAILTLTFVGLTLVLCLREPPTPLSVVPGVMALHFGINTVRVIAYARRHVRPTSVGSASASPAARCTSSAMGESRGSDA